MAEIALHQVSKRFNGALGVNNVSFTIRDREFFILVGPSGCGKSTLLNMIAGLEKVSEGAIAVDGRVVNDLDPKDRNMAMVFQSYAIYPHMTVRENMAFPLKLAKLPREEVARRVDRAARALELTDLLARKPSSLSGGQRQRVAMGRAIVREPLAFLMDEPLSNLDAKLRVQMRTEIARLQRQLGTTTVYVTHDQTEAMTLGDRVAVLRAGVVQQIGTPRDLYTSPSNLFVAGFIGLPAMNFVPARIDGEHLRLPMADMPLVRQRRKLLPHDGTTIIAGIRPEHLTDQAPSGIAPENAVRFRAQIEVIEWMGAELYAYFDVPEFGAQKTPAWQRDLQHQTSMGDSIHLVARLGAASNAAEGKGLELCFDEQKLHLFCSETGERLDARTEVDPVG
jgi:multiple sugar transport system ATP-binding protein